MGIGYVKLSHERPHASPRRGEWDPRLTCGSVTLAPSHFPPSSVSHLPGGNQQLLLSEIKTSICFTAWYSALSYNPSCLKITASTVGTKVSWHRVGFIPRNWICQGVVIETEWGNVKVPWAKPDRENSCLLLSWGWGGAMSTCDYQIWGCSSPLNKRDILTQCNLCLVSHIFNVNYLKYPLTVVDITPAVCFWHSVQCAANPHFAFQGALSVCFPK